MLYISTTTNTIFAFDLDSNHLAPFLLPLKVQQARMYEARETLLRAALTGDPKDEFHGIVPKDFIAAALFLMSDVLDIP